MFRATRGKAFIQFYNITTKKRDRMKGMKN